MNFEPKTRCTVHGILVAFAVIATTVSLPTQAQSDLVNKLSESIGMNVGHVAVKVAELPEKSRGLFVRGLDFSPDGSKLAVGLDLSDINIWDWKKKSILQGLHKLPSTISTAHRQVLYSPDGKLLAACHGPGEHDVAMRIWETRTWAILKDIDNSGIAGLGCVDMQFTPDGKYLFRAPERINSRGELVAYDTSTWQLVWNVPFHDFSAATIAVNPNGILVAAGGEQLSTVPESAAYPLGVRGDRLIKIIDIKQRQLTGQFPVIAVDSMTWSPAGQLVTAGQEYVEFFEGTSGKNFLRQHDKESAHRKVAYSPNGKYFVDSDFNARGTGIGVNIWDRDHRNKLQHISGNFSSIAISRDSRYLAIGEIGRTTIWQFSQ